MLETSHSTLHARLRQGGLPIRTTFETTYGCNLNCVHCFNPTHQATARELSTHEAKALLDQLAQVGALFVGITGGEPLTRPDLFDVLSYAKVKGLLIMLMTNATLITPERAHRLAALDLYRVEVSVYGATAGTYERVTRVPGSFAKFVRGVDLLLERGVPVRLKTIVLSLNVHEVDAMRQFAESRGLHFEYASDVQPKANGDPEPLRYRLPPSDATRVWTEQVICKNLKGAQQRYGLADESNGCDQQSRTRLFDCACGQSSCAVSPYGEMNLCASYHIPQYDVRQGSVADGWAFLRQYVDAAQPRADFPCPTCPVERFCDRNVSHAILEMGDANACVPYHLERATLRKTTLEQFAV